MSARLIKFIREQYRSNDPIALHSPVFSGKEKQYVDDAISSSFVSSVGEYVDRFENEIAAFTKSSCAVATVNGTSSLHIALKLAGVTSGDLVITQPITFVATCNSIAYCGAEPVFVDVDFNTIGLSPSAMDGWLNDHAYIGADGLCLTSKGDRVVRACLPMHTFGHPADLAGIVDICKRWNITLVEDAAEALGSLYGGQHVGTIGSVGTLSFNGNKIITTGGGGMILTNQTLGALAKHLTTTAKVPHQYEYFHDQIGYNYRMPNLNAAMGCAQLERIEMFIENKRNLAFRYADYFSNSDIKFVSEPEGCRSNFWLNAVICESRKQRDELLKATNQNGVMTRPIWTLTSRLPAFSHSLRGPLKNAEWLESRVLNLPSSVVS